MSTGAPLHAYTYSDYLAHEEASNVKHEYLNGEIYAMAGGTPEHASLAVAIASLLRNQLAGKECRVFSSDLRIRIVETGLTTYPDVSVVCGPLELDPQSRETVLNPRVLVEVLSHGTERYDRGEKFEHYKRVSSLEEYVLVSQKEPWIEVFRRSDNSWTHLEAGSGARVTLQSIECQLEVDEVYRGVFEP
jgi:Uma2 family endonuclease